MTVWIESHQSLGAHPKTKKLARLLDLSIPTAVGHLHCLWWWAMDYAQDGSLARYDDLDVAVGAMWEGDPAAFRSALHSAGFVDPDEAIHDWDEYAGKLIARREANAERMRQARAGTKNGSAEHVQGTQRARASLQYQQYQENQPLSSPTPPQRDASSSPAPEEEEEEETTKSLLTILDGRFPDVVVSFSTVDKNLDAAWLKKALTRVEKQTGPLPRDKLTAGLADALRALRQRMTTAAAGGPPIGAIRPYTTELVLERLKEQADAIVS